MSIQFNCAQCSAHTVLRMAQLAGAYAVTFIAAAGQKGESVEFLLPGRPATLTLRAGQYLHLNGNMLSVTEEP